MFAFAIWDARRRQLLLARDRLGIKPLYYVEAANSSSLFASEIKSLLQARAYVPGARTRRGLRRYLAYRFPYGNGTLFKGIRSLPPGHVMVAMARDGHPSVLGRADPARCQGTRPVTDFLRPLDESVRLRMISDVPIGAFLSGGIDSSVVTTLMSRHADG